MGDECCIRLASQCPRLATLRLADTAITQLGVRCLDLECNFTCAHNIEFYVILLMGSRFPVSSPARSPPPLAITRHATYPYHTKVRMLTILHDLIELDMSNINDLDDEELIHLAQRCTRLRVLKLSNAGDETSPRKFTSSPITGFPTAQTHLPPPSS